eukprot:UN01646
MFGKKRGTGRKTMRNWIARIRLHAQLIEEQREKIDSQTLKLSTFHSAKSQGSGCFAADTLVYQQIKQGLDENI